MICCNCGAEIKDDSLFCPNCGGRQEEGNGEIKEAAVEAVAQAVQQNTANVPEKKKSGKGLIIALVFLLVLAGAGAGGYFYLKSKNMTFGDLISSFTGGGNAPSGGETNTNSSNGVYESIVDHDSYYDKTVTETVAAGDVSNSFVPYKIRITSIGNNVKIRISPSTGENSTKVGNVKTGEVYTVYEDVQNEGYTWHRIGENRWMADDGTWTERID